ncbi:hypothetical protein DC522_28720 [Microvirga sp. KLBC 81]|uniref:hypothetical protein n=1 Tax=Microvirga sp. KLBC 81 TaxID=1862707 RepID=UPI000D507AB0|nr:hypothetical protein [Microvirga sp. KLBC 81]PVE21065.1 hypothetical protein DC522_28720 [Microvirga sp. KLBC 81]
MTVHQQNSAWGEASLRVHRTHSIPADSARPASKTSKWPLWASIALIIIANTLIWGLLISAFM